MDISTTAFIPAFVHIGHAMLPVSEINTCDTENFHMVKVPDVLQVCRDDGIQISGFPDATWHLLTHFTGANIITVTALNYILAYTYTCLEHKLDSTA